MKKKAMLSQPMAGKSNEEIVTVREHTAALAYGVEIIYEEDEPKEGI